VTGTVSETAPETPSDSEQFMDLVARLCTAQPDLSPIQAGIIIAAEQNIARDSRTFARLLGLAHALVLREITTLCDQNRLTIAKQDARTLRTFYEII
jgi:sulfur transfer complex TusBCD TusB component (DsrH family)